MYTKIGLHIQFWLNRAKIATLPEDLRWLPKFLFSSSLSKVAFVPVIAVFTIVSVVTLITLRLVL
jgi:hypothetical protein